MDDSGEPKPKNRFPRPWSLALALTILVALVWADPLFMRRNFAGRDLLAYNLPMEKAVHDAYARGRFPLWSSEISGGRPLLPNPNAGAMYPMRILLAPLPLPWAIKVFTVFHWCLAGIGMLALERTLGASRSGAWIAAVTYVFSGVVVSEVFFPHILPGMALLPWVVWCLRHSGSWALRAVLLSAALASGILAGDIFTVGMALLAGLGWIAFGAERQERRTLTLLFAAASALAVLAALPQILATALWIPETNRAVTGVTWREATLYTISPYRLLELVVPYPFGDVWSNDHGRVWGGERVFSGKLAGLFLTLYAGALGVIALATTLRHRTPAARFGRFLAVGAVILSSVWLFVPPAWRDRAAPLALRNPEKFAVLLPFGLAILSAAALDDLRARARLPRWIWAAAAGLASLAVCAAVSPRAAGAVGAELLRSGPASVDGASRTLPFALAEGALLWTATLAGLELIRSRSRPVFLSGMAALTFVPIAATRRLGWTLSQDGVFAAPPFVRALQKWDPRGDYRALGEMAYRDSGALEAAESGNDPGFPNEVLRRNFVCNTQALWGRGAVVNTDFDVGDLSRVVSVRKLSRVEAAFPDPAAFFGSLSLRWGIRYRDQEPPVAGFSLLRRQGPDAWDENRRALPDIRLATGWREEPDALSALRDLPGLADGQVVLETGRRSAGSAPEGRVRIVERSPERLILDTESAAPAWLFVLRGFWSHRTVRVDGREVDVVPAQLAFSAIPIPAGTHRVAWSENFPGWTVSRFGPPLYALAVAALWLSARNRPGEWGPQGTR